MELFVFVALVGFEFCDTLEKLTDDLFTFWNRLYSNMANVELHGKHIPVG